MTEVAANLGANPRADKRAYLLGATGLLALLFFLVHLGLGSTEFVSPLQVVKELFKGRATSGEDSVNAVVWAVRLPKALYCVLTGGILGIVGSAFQALFRNPLAEPYTIGVSSGAAVGGVIAQLVGLDAALVYLGTPLLGFVGGMAALGLVLALSKRRQGTDSTTLLLAGVVVASLLSALLSVIILMSGQDSRQLMSWLMGSTSPQFMERVALLTVVLLVGGAILIRETRRLNAFAISENAARRVGVDPRRLRTVILVVGTAMTGAAVGTVGAVGFLGLVAPHIARRILGVDWRWSLPGSLFTGASLMLAADALAQRFLPWLGHLLTGRELLATELPVGVVTALLGAPALLVLLRKTD